MAVPEEITQRTYISNRGRITITTGNHPDTLQPIYAVAIDTEKTHVVQPGFGGFNDAVRDLQNELELDPETLTQFPLLESED